eukprot:CAMPEP_0202686586 /NCGR_PEP_ID=MMETSP1385-20130828/2335_1 /ASSEMBLY_ACC=CAM_ASM_000861 /TAXON_ID=933848 /ORGANISM="Elphidium margaritaceum" /LENGTH=472 /DNA_ID=CAMNT_0049341191 /DNA_START=257 /DNA_END=1676 /DNA_ORIENTATION=+
MDIKKRPTEHFVVSCIQAMDRIPMQVDALRDQASKSPEIRMFKNNTNTYREKSIAKKNRLDFNVFNNVIAFHIDGGAPDGCWADVEASTTFDTLVRHCGHSLKWKYIPTVTPELKSITVGGVAVGLGLESSSFRYGFLHNSVLECDVLLADGRIVTCTPHNQYSDLFFAIPNSLGCFGYLLRVRLRIVACKPYVLMENVLCESHDVLVDQLLDACNPAKAEFDFDFIDGLAYHSGYGRMLKGKMIDSIDVESQFSIYHEYIDRNQAERQHFIMSIERYLWRWDADFFYLSKYVAPLNNKLIRWYLTPDVMRSDVLRHFHQLLNGFDFGAYKEQGKQAFIQDVVVPAQFTKQWVKFHQEEMLYLNKENPYQYPLWLCPTKNDEQDFTLFSVTAAVNINFGFWAPVAWDRKLDLDTYLESNLDRFQAKKWLYSHVRFSKDELYRRYGGSKYFELKRKYDKQNKIRDLYNKCTQK